MSSLGEPLAPRIGWSVPRNGSKFPTITDETVVPPAPVRRVPQHYIDRLNRNVKLGAKRVVNPCNWAGQGF